ncbi:septum site-determining protein Ssd, partial [Corynebacterium mastitidis]
PGLGRDHEPALGAALPHGAPAVYLVGQDPGPVPHAAVVECRAERGFVIPAQAADLLRALGHTARAGSPAPTASGRIIGVMGAVGGAGASTLAVAVARRMARHGRVVLVDAVDASGGLDLLLGCEDAPGARWPDVRMAEGAVAVDEMVAALPESEGVSVLSAARGGVDEGYRLGEADLRGALEAVRRGRLSAVVDLPAGGEAAEEGARACDEVVLCPAEVRAGARAATLGARLRAGGVPAGLVVRHRQWSSLSVEDVQRLSELGVVAELPTIAGLAKATELRGVPARLPKALRSVAGKILR